MIRTEHEWTDEYQKRGALWIHDDNPNRPHALLTSGQHSNGFFNSRLIIENEPLLRDAAADLVSLFEKDFSRHSGDLSMVSRVVGPKTGGTRLAEFVSDCIGQRRKFPCWWSSPTKAGEGDNKRFVFDDPARGVGFGDKCLLVEDVLTTGASLNGTVQAIYEAGGIAFPFALVLVNRSYYDLTGGRKNLALINHHLPIWTAEECPLCQKGSQAIRPKEPPENWARLTATY